MAPLILLTVVLIGSPAGAQQFNSDSSLSKDPGVAPIILTAGERNSTFMTTFSLLPKWEFTLASFLYNDDENRLTVDGYSTTFYANYMFLQNTAKTGGAAVKFGTGLRPGEVAEADADGQDAFRTLWANAPMTLPLLHNKLSVDLMPGVSMTSNFGDDESVAWSFTYSGRVAWYAWSPTTSIVGEVFGSEGQATAIPEYKIGLRGEPNPSVVCAVTYGREFAGDGSNDANSRLA